MRYEHFPISLSLPYHHPDLMPLSPNVDVDPLVHEPALSDGPGVGRGRPRVQLVAALERPAVPVGRVIIVRPAGADVYDPRVAVNALLQHSGIPIQHKWK